MLILIFLTVLESFMAKVDTALFETDYRLSITESGRTPMAINGHLTMQGEQFAATIFDTEAAYDGSTLYIYNPTANELTLSEPTKEELKDSNPLLYAKSLMVKHANDIVVKSEANGIPTSLTMRDGTRVFKLTLVNPSFPATTNCTFTVTKEGAYVNDLR